MYQEPQAARAVQPHDEPAAHSGVAAAFAGTVAAIDSRTAGGRQFGVRFWDGSELPGSAGGPGSPTLWLRHPDALVRMLRAPGELGFARAWVSGDLDVDGDLEAALSATEEWRSEALRPSDAFRALAAARQLGLLRRPAPPVPGAEARLSGRAHSVKRDGDAISHHYDVSNAFYRQMLGPTMVYSCAVFGSPGESLEAAQRRKLDLICRKLELHRGMTLLDIGCGWGSLLMHAAGCYGVKAVGVTVSQEQAALARERIRAAGLTAECEVRVEDYRDISDGPYDRIASVGMFEHVGGSNLALYFDRVRELLAPGGLFLNHGIVRTQPGHISRRGFTHRYVFPDGELHTQGRVIDSLEDAGFELLDDESLRPHYARTLRLWAANHDAGIEAAAAEIGRERERVWRLHNHGAALAFERGSLSIHQVIAQPLATAGTRPLRVRSYPASASSLESRI